MGFLGLRDRFFFPIDLEWDINKCTEAMFTDVSQIGIDVASHASQNCTNDIIISAEAGKNCSKKCRNILGNFKHWHGSVTRLIRGTACRRIFGRHSLRSLWL